MDPCNCTDRPYTHCHIGSGQITDAFGRISYFVTEVKRSDSAAMPVRLPVPVSGRDDDYPGIPDAELREDDYRIHVSDVDTFKKHLANAIRNTDWSEPVTCCEPRTRHCHADGSRHAIPDEPCGDCKPDVDPILNVPPSNCRCGAPAHPYHCCRLPAPGGDVAAPVYTNSCRQCDDSRGYPDSADPDVLVFVRYDGHRHAYGEFEPGRWIQVG